MKTYTYQYGIAYHTDTESWGPLAVVCTIDGIAQDVTRFQTREELDLFMLESIIPNTIRTDVHAHYCVNCEAYSPCWGKPQPSCLLTDSCVACQRVLDGVEPVAVGVDNKTFYLI